MNESTAYHGTHGQIQGRPLRGRCRSTPIAKTLGLRIQVGNRQMAALDCRVKCTLNSSPFMRKDSCYALQPSMGRPTDHRGSNIPHKAKQTALVITQPPGNSTYPVLPVLPYSSYPREVDGNTSYEAQEAKYLGYIVTYNLDMHPKFLKAFVSPTDRPTRCTGITGREPLGRNEEFQEKKYESATRPEVPIWDANKFKRQKLTFIPPAGVKL
ncbi:hypothetical protein ARMGADRAFT_1112840 [Armillaria gallica]|uniref:Uncharacterized protein n=1 Tax=Armillaria gallica TaxID=47427 RepID=A0A2H3DED9_ARMGA|nr:hypothetical protein ARMGADRAFT_1112840 [Armillaria gallica]